MLHIYLQHVSCAMKKEELENYAEPWKGWFKKLDGLLLYLQTNLKLNNMPGKNQTKITAEPGKQELFITREFEAPRELVFEAFEDPDLLMQWMGPRELKTEIEKLDSRSGGSYRFIHKDANGNAFGFNGVIHEVTKPERMIRTFEFEGLPERGHVSMETMLFEDLPGNRSRITIQAVFRSVDDRDGLVASGMERGLVDSHLRLDDLLAKKTA